MQVFHKEKRATSAASQHSDAAEPVTHSDAAEPVTHSDATKPVTHSDAAEPVTHSDAAEPVTQLHSVATAKLSTMSMPEEPVVGSLTGTQYEEMVCVMLSIAQSFLLKKE